MSPDVATCDDCLHELWDPADRRCRHNDGGISLGQAAVAAAHDRAPR